MTTCKNPGVSPRGLPQPSRSGAAMHLHALEHQHPYAQRVDGDFGDPEAFQVVQQRPSVLMLAALRRLLSDGSTQRQNAEPIFAEI